MSAVLSSVAEVFGEIALFLWGVLLKIGDWLARTVFPFFWKHASAATGALIALLWKGFTQLFTFLVKVMVGESKGGLTLALIVDAAILFPIGLVIGGEAGTNLLVASFMMGVGGIVMAIVKIAK